MATSGSKSVTVTSWDTLKFSWSEVSQSVANNNTKISWLLQLISGSSGRIDSSASKDWSVTVNGTKYSGTNTIGIANNATKTLASGTTTIAHNADGTKTFSYSFSQDIEITFSGSWIGTKSGSGTGTLDTIPRATTPTLSASSVDMGDTVTISLPRASSSFTHDLAYSFAGSAYTSIKTGVATSHTWTVPDKATSIPSATSGTMTIRCITKNGSTTIGTKTVTLTAKVPASVVPTASIGTPTEAVSGLAAQFGAFIQNKSKVKVAVTGAGAKGSTITAYQSTLLGTTYTSNNWTSGLLTSSGTVAIKARVKDSRGRWSAYATYNLTVLAYSPPQIQELSCYRCDANGNAATDGVYVAVSYKYSVTSLNSKNTAAMAVNYKKSTETDDAYAQLLSSTTLSGNTTVRPASPTFSTDYQYDLKMTLTDWFGPAITYQAILPSGAVILDILANGEGISFFKTAETAGLADFGAEVMAREGVRYPLIPDGADLNDYKAPGSYSSANTAVAGGYVNTPLDGESSFTLEVLTGEQDNNITQRLTTISKTWVQVWTRAYYADAWGDWSRVFFQPGTPLWSGVYSMVASHTATLSEPVSQQPTGIVLIFSGYQNSAAGNYWYHSYFVPKYWTSQHGGGGHCIPLVANGVFSYIGAKYLYISDTKIVGNDDNSKTGTKNGVTYDNSKFVLRYVIGV